MRKKIQPAKIEGGDWPIIREKVTRFIAKHPNRPPGEHMETYLSAIIPAVVNPVSLADLPDLQCRTFQCFRNRFCHCYAMRPDFMVETLSYARRLLGRLTKTKQTAIEHVIRTFPFYIQNDKKMVRADTADDGTFAIFVERTTGLKNISKDDVKKARARIRRAEA